MFCGEHKEEKRILIGERKNMNVLPPLCSSLSEIVSVKNFAVESVQRCTGWAAGDVIE